MNKIYKDIILILIFKGQADGAPVIRLDGTLYDNVHTSGIFGKCCGSIIKNNGYKFLRNLRMEQAARLLRESKVNVSQVAFKVGYTDQAHFSTAFKTHFGMSPSEYIETHKE